MTLFIEEVLDVLEICSNATMAGFIHSSNLMKMPGIRQEASLVSQDLADTARQKEISVICYLALLLRNCVNFTS